MNKMIGMIALVTLACRPLLANWTYYPSGHASNPHPDGVSAGDVISNGTWVINVYLDANQGARKLIVGKTGIADADRRGCAFTGIGSGTLDLRGTITDVDSSATTYQIVSHSCLSLGARNDGGRDRTGAMKIYISPGTLWFFGGQEWNSEYKVMKRITLDEPIMAFDWTGTWNFPDNLKHLDLRIPKITAIKKNVINNIYGTPYTNSVSGWNLSGVTNVGELAFCQMTKVSGVLHLPSLQEAGASAFTNSAFSGLEFGKSGVTTVFGVNALKGLPKLREIAFRGDVPVLTDAIWGGENRAERSLVFAVPTNDRVWRDFLANKIVRRVEPAEAAAYLAANPEVHYVPYAVVSRTAFATANDQYLADSRWVKPEVSCDTYFGDRVEIVSADRTSDDLGRYPVGTTICLRAVPAVGGTFVCWYGDVEDAVRSNAEVSVCLKSSTPWCFARIVRDWKYDAASGLAANGHWKVRAVPNDDGEDTLTLGAAEMSGLFPSEGNEGVRGVLDLGGNVVDAAGKRWRYTRFRKQNSLCSIKGDGSVCGYATHFLSPGTLLTLSGAQLFNVSGTARRSYEMIVLDERKAAGGLSSWYFAAQTKLTRLVLRLDALTSISSSCTFGDTTDSTPLDQTDLSWWRLPGMVSLPNRAFLVNWNPGEDTVYQGVRAYGTLDLPNCTSVGESAFRAMENLEGARLGGAVKKAKVTAIGANAFCGCPAFAALAVHCDATLTVATNAFVGTRPQELIFDYKAPTSDALDSFLKTSLTTMEAKPPVIFASSRIADWLPKAGLVSEIATSERANMPSGTFAVYRPKSFEATEKCWVVDRPSDYDPRGFLIQIR